MRNAIRRPCATSGTIFHSDRGSQYASEEFRGLLKSCGLKPSMSRKSDCWDNACVENFFGLMKRERRDPIWESRAIAQAAIFEYIEIRCNWVRRQSTFDYKSPEEYDSSLPIAALLHVREIGTSSLRRLRARCICECKRKCRQCRHHERHKPKAYACSVH